MSVAVVRKLEQGHSIVHAFIQAAGDATRRAG
ncbi:MAG: hypothetical protein V7646_6471 [Pseudonocardia sp.]|jgi:hypothetical protein